MVRKGYTFDDVLLVPSYSKFLSRKDVDTKIELGPYKFGIPIISSNMDTITGSLMARKMAELGGLGILHRFMTETENVREFILATQGTENVVGVSIGVLEGLDRAEKLFVAGARLFVVDTAHAHSKQTGETIKSLRNRFGETIYIVAGNVATTAGADYLASCGADCIKVGIGGGSGCTTRLKTGFGVPQLTAIQDCSRIGKPIIADGGITKPADMVKALAAGATMVMIGGLFAGCDEACGSTVLKLEDSIPVSYKEFRGMASKEAQQAHFGGVPEWKTAEGVSHLVKAKGPVEEVIHDLVGGLRSGLTYCGAKNILELQRKAEFIEVTPNTRRENESRNP